MQFLYPVFLWGILGALIPLIIHFFNFQRPKKIFFTHTELLKEVQQTAVSRNKLKNLLTLLMRMLAVAFLSFAFAQPYFERDNAAKVARGSHVSIYLDNSYGTQNFRNDKRVFDIQTQIAYKITEVYPKTTAFQLTDNNFESNTQSFYDKSKILDKLSTMPFSPLGRNLKTVGAKQIAALDKAGAGSSSHIFWISDFQKSSVGNLDELTFDSAKMYFLVPVLPTQNSNIYADSLWLENPFVRVGGNNVLNVRLRNLGNERAEDKNLRLLIGGKQVAAAVFSAEPNGEATVKINFSLTEGGMKPCVLQIDDSPIIFDNEHFFIIKAASKIKVTVITDEKESFCEKAYQDEELFDLKSYGFGNIDYNRLLNSDLIVLENLRNIDKALAENLLQAGEKGVNIAVFPDAKGDLEAITRVFNAPVTPLTTRESIALQVPDVRNPFFEGVFENLSSTMNMPNVTPILSISGGKRILRTKSNETFMAEFQKRNSAVYFFAAPLGETGGGFAKHAIFVPVAYKMALNSAFRGERLYWNFSDDYALINADSLGKNDMVKLRGSDGREIIPGQRRSGNNLQIEIPRFGAEAGVFEVLRKSDNVKIALIAFNTDKRESSTEYYELDELKKIAENNKNVSVIADAEPDSFAAEFRGDNISNALWRFFIVLVLVAFLAETLIIRFWKS